MILDIILVFALFVWAVFGYRKGFVKQIFALCGVLCIVFFSAPLADIAEKVLVNEFGLNLTGRYLRGFLLMGCGSLLYVLTFIMGRFLHNTLVKGISFAESTNHILGTVMGLTECVLGIYFILCLFSIGQNRIREYAPDVHEFISQSNGYQIADSNNLLRNYEFFKSPISAQPQTDTAPSNSETPDLAKPADSVPAQAGTQDSPALVEKKRFPRQPVNSGNDGK